MPPLSRAQFEALVEEALGALPAPVRGLLTNVEISVRARPGGEARNLGGRLFGLYAGPTREEMLSPLSGPMPPARILLYQDNLQAAFPDPQELRRQITFTVRHEIAHHLGIDDARLHEIWPEGA